MNNLELKEDLSRFVEKHGTEGLAKIVSDAIDQSNLVNRQSIALIRKRFVDRFNFWSRFNLTER